MASQLIPPTVLDTPDQTGTLLFTFGGTVQDGATLVPYFPDFAATIDEVRLNRSNDPAAVTTVDVELNGSSIFAAPPTIPSGEFFGSGVIPTTTSWAPDNRLEVVVDDAGSSENLVVAIAFTRT